MCTKQVFQLLEPGEGTEIEDLFGHIDSLVDLTKLLGSLSCVPLTTEARQLRVDLVEGHSIASVVSGARPNGKLTAGKGTRNDLSDLFDPVVIAVLSDIEDLIANGFSRRLQRASDRMTDI